MNLIQGIPADAAGELGRSSPGTSKHLAGLQVWGTRPLMLTNAVELPIEQHLSSQKIEAGIH